MKSVSSSSSPSPLVPVVVPQDGNEFYVYASLAIFECHDRHGEIRRRLWDAFCLQIYNVRMSELKEDGEQPIVESARHTRCFGEWLALYTPRPRDYSRAVDLTDATLMRAVLGAVRCNAMDGVTAPLVLASTLLSDCYGVSVVIYDTTSDIGGGGGNGSESWDASQTIHPNNNNKHKPLKCIHFALRGRSLQMLVLPKDSTSSLKGHAIPNHPIGSIPGRLRLSLTADAASVAERATYTLCVYDAAARRHFEVCPFVPPAAASPGHIHYALIDTRMSKREIVFVVGGCTKTTVPIHIYAVQTQGNRRKATRIGHWAVDYIDPRIELSDKDDAIIIVPTADQAFANQCVAVEYHCKVVEPGSQ